MARRALLSRCMLSAHSVQSQTRPLSGQVHDFVKSMRSKPNPLVPEELSILRLASNACSEDFLFRDRFLASVEGRGVADVAASVGTSLGVPTVAGSASTDAALTDGRADGISFVGACFRNGAATSARQRSHCQNTVFCSKRPSSRSLRVRLQMRPSVADLRSVRAFHPPSRRLPQRVHRVVPSDGEVVFLFVPCLVCFVCCKCADIVGDDASNNREAASRCRSASVAAEATSIGKRSYNLVTDAMIFRTTLLGKLPPSRLLLNQTRNRRHGDVDRSHYLVQSSRPRS